MDTLAARLHTRRRLPMPEMRRAIRRNARATQVDIAEMLDVHPVTVARWEAGTREPRGELRERYVAVLDALLAVSES